MGAAGRYLISTRLNRDYPIGTLLVNLFGSFALGLLFGGITERWVLLLLATGFSGGFTTFSTMNIEILNLSKRKAILAVTYAGTSYIFGIAAAWIGWQLGSIIL